MHTINYRIHALSPLVLSAKYGDMNMVSTHHYIPGTTVLGIIATQWIQKKNLQLDQCHDNEFFFKHFLLGDLIFSHAYIVDHHKYFEKYYPTPLSIVKNKHTHEIIDQLFIDTLDKGHSLNEFCLINTEEQSIQTKEVDVALNFHHARDRKRGTSKTGLIFNYESIKSGQVFEGKIVGSNTALKQLLETCNPSWFTYAGRSKNNQYGKIKFEFLEHEPKIVQPDIYSENPKQISLTLLSDTIVYNNYGYSVTDKHTLEHYLGGTINICKAFARTSQIETFVGKWQLKSPQEICFVAGSTFLLDISPEDHAIIERLAIEGIGERRNEGFGQCQFGLQTNETLFEMNQNNNSLLEEPEDERIPDQTKTIIRQLIQNHLIKSTRMIAFSDQKSFKRLPNKSLLSKLNAMIQAGDRKMLNENLLKLNHTAIQHLTYCVNHEKSLLEFLSQTDITTETLMNQISHRSLEKMCKCIQYEPENDKALEKQLFQTYYTTFFAMMRKRIFRIN